MQVDGLGRSRFKQFRKALKKIAPMAVAPMLIAPKIVRKAVPRRFISPKALRKAALISVAAGGGAAFLLARRRAKKRKRPLVSRPAAPVPVRLLSRSGYRPDVSAPVPYEAESPVQEYDQEPEREQPDAAQQSRVANTLVAAQRVPASFVPPMDSEDAESIPQVEEPDVAEEPYVADEPDVGEEPPPYAQGEDLTVEEPPGSLQGLGRIKWKKVRKNLRKVAMVATVAAAAYYGAPLLTKALKGSKGAAQAAGASGATGLLESPQFLATAASLIKKKMAADGKPVTDEQAMELARAEAAQSKRAIDQGRPPPDTEGGIKWVRMMPIILPVFALAIAAMKG